MTHDLQCFRKNLRSSNQSTILQSSRRLGLSVIGAPGSGKSTLLEQLILQDIEQNRGLALIDPHGDLIENILKRAKSRLEDIILLEPSFESYPFGINLYEGSSASEADRQRRIDEVMDIFEKLYEVSRTTPRMSQFLRNCSRTILFNPGYTLADIPLLLMDASFRKRLVANVTDSQTLLFWRHYDSLRPADQMDVAESTINKLDELLQPVIRNIVGQSKTTINFRQIMDQGKILLCKLDSRSRATTSLMGSLIIAGMTNAAFSREDIHNEKKRRQFNVYADEFPRFATHTFSILFSETRKYGIATTVAYQNRTQLDELNAAATRSVANMVMFRINGEDAKELITELAVDIPEPEMEEAGQRSIRVPTSNVVEYFLMHGSSNASVQKFIHDYLKPLKEISLRHEEYYFTGKVQGDRLKSWSYSGEYIIFPDKVREGLALLNDILFERMTHVDSLIREAIRRGEEGDDPKKVTAWMREQEERSRSKVASDRFHAIRRLSGFLKAELLGGPNDAGPSDRSLHDYTIIAPDYVSEGVLHRNEEITQVHYPKHWDYWHLNNSDSFLVKLRHQLVYDIQKADFTQCRRLLERELSIAQGKEPQEDNAKRQMFEMRGYVAGWLKEEKLDSLDRFEVNREKYRAMADPKRYQELLYIQEEFTLIETFVKLLEEACRDLENNMILVDSGRYETLYRPKSPRPISDLQNELILKLTQLPLFTAYAKITGDAGVITEKFITYRPPKDIRDSRRAIVEIRERNIKQGYLRPKAEVEQEISSRQKMDPPYRPHKG